MTARLNDPFRSGSDGPPVELQVQPISDDTQVALAEVVAQRR